MDAAAETRRAELLAGGDGAGGHRLRPRAPADAAPAALRPRSRQSRRPDLRRRAAGRTWRSTCASPRCRRWASRRSSASRPTLRTHPAAGGREPARGRATCWPWPSARTAAVASWPTFAAIEEHVAALARRPDRREQAELRRIRGDGAGRALGILAGAARRAASSATPAAPPARCATARAAPSSATSRSGSRWPATTWATWSGTSCAPCTWPAAASTAATAARPARWVSRCTC